MSRRDSFCLLFTDYGYDCNDILDRGFGSTDGVYEIKLKGSDEIVKVYCDMATQGGGWTVRFELRSIKTFF